MDEKEKVSKFSSGLNIIMRLDILWKNCQSYKRNGKYAQWNDELDTIWLELARDITEREYFDREDKDGKKIKGIKSQFDEFEERLKKELPFMDVLNKFSTPSKDILNKRDAQYKILMDKQLFLARLENKYGKGTTYSDEEDEDF